MAHHTVPNAIPDALKSFDLLPDSANVRRPIVQTVFGCSSATNWTMVFALSVTFAGPLANLTGEDSRDFHLKISSSSKTTVLKKAAYLLANGQGKARVGRTGVVLYSAPSLWPCLRFECRRTPRGTDCRELRQLWKCKALARSCHAHPTKHVQTKDVRCEIFFDLSCAFEEVAHLRRCYRTS